MSKTLIGILVTIAAFAFIGAALLGCVGLAA